MVPLKKNNNKLLPLSTFHTYQVPEISFLFFPFFLKERLRRCVLQKMEFSVSSPMLVDFGSLKDFLPNKKNRRIIFLDLNQYHFLDII